jgi:hypothetical protein
MTKEELQTIWRLHQIVTTGQETGKLKSPILVSLTREEADHRLYLARNPNIVKNLRVRLADCSFFLFGDTISVGPRSIVVPDASIDLTSLQSELNRNAHPMNVQISAASEKPIQVVYDKWKHDSKQFLSQRLETFLVCAHQGLHTKLSWPTC